MTDIMIHPKDQLKVKIECQSGLAYEIAEHFSFYVPGYKFMPRFKSGYWDGRIKMMDVRSREFPKGLIPRLFQWSKENQYTFGISQEAKVMLRPGVQYDESWFNDFDKKGKFIPRPHQKKAVDAILGMNQVLIKSPTASGKSYMIYMVVRYLLEHTDQDILITVPTTGLVEQIFSDFEDYTIDGWNTSEHCNKIYSGKDKNTKHRVQISTWQSVYKLDKSWFNRYGAYICDEAHGADSKSISGIVDKINFAPIRVGLTGTLDGTLLHELEMLARFGPLFVAATTIELMESGDLAPLEIECIKIQYTDEEIKLIKNASYEEEIDFLIGHKLRNKKLVNLALAEGSDKNVLMLFHEIEKHGKLIHKILLEEAEKVGKTIYYIAGEIEVEDREVIRKLLETKTNCILLASMGTFSTGINVKNLHTVIFCRPYKAPIKTLQSIGRTLRISAGKLGAKLYDIADDLVYKTKSGSEKMNTAMKHFIERLKIYQNEQFKYKIVNVSIND